MPECACCRFCLRLLFTAGLTALFLWLSLRTSGPTCTVEDLEIPSLNQSGTATSRANDSLAFHLRFKNTNKDKRIYYDALNLSFYYLPALGAAADAAVPLSNYTIPPFRQGHAKKAHRKDAVHVAPRRIPPQGSNRTAFFRVGLVTKVRYKILFWKTKRHDMKVAADVEVNDGRKVEKGGIKLKSDAPERCCYIAPLLVGLFGYFALAFSN